MGKGVHYYKSANPVRIFIKQKWGLFFLLFTHANMGIDFYPVEEDLKRRQVC